MDDNAQRILGVIEVGHLYRDLIEYRHMYLARLQGVFDTPTNQVGGFLYLSVQAALGFVVALISSTTGMS
jgi:hypothetical protein